MPTTPHIWFFPTNLPPQVTAPLPHNLVFSLPPSAFIRAWPISPSLFFFIVRVLCQEIPTPIPHFRFTFSAILCQEILPLIRFRLSSSHRLCLCVYAMTSRNFFLHAAIYFASPDGFALQFGVVNSLMPKISPPPTSSLLPFKALSPCSLPSGVIAIFFSRNATKARPFHTTKVPAVNVQSSVF